MGTDQDLVARTVAPDVAKNLGARNVIVINLPEAGGIEAWNYIYDSKDGLAFGDLDQGDAFVKTIRQDPALKFDPRDFTYVGFTYPPRSLFPTAVKDGGYDTIEKLQAATGLKGAVSSAFGDYHLITVIFSEMFNLDIKIAGGMRGGERVIALTNDTIQLSTFGPDYYVRYENLKPLAVASAKRWEGIDVPTLTEAMPAGISEDLVKLVKFADNVLTGGHAIVTSPGIPDDRAAFLGEAIRKAYLDHGADIAKFMELNVPALTESMMISPEETLRLMQENLQDGEQLRDIMDRLFEKFKA